jgi:endoglucanase
MTIRSRLRAALPVLAALTLAPASCGGGGGGPASPSTPTATPAPAAQPYGGEAVPKAFVRRRGASLVAGADDRPVRLQGVCFGNGVWGNPASAPASHHSEIDLDRVRDMNMNAIRFYLNDALLQSGAAWDWIDRNVAWARSRGVYLVLNMHVPPGGFQSLGDGMALWNDAANRDRLRSQWRQVAERYRAEPVIAGYDLVNEPIVPTSIDQWQDLASSLVREIRSVDTNHLIVVERLNGVKGKWETYGGLNFLSLADAGIVHTFHYYSPIEYTHQHTSWTGLGEGGPYPDPNVLQVPSDVTWKTTTGSDPALPAGDSGWTYYEGVRWKAEDASIIVGKPVFASDKNAGTAYFDDFTVLEYDEGGRVARQIARMNVESLSGWSFWANNGAGRMFLADEGHGDRASIAIAGTTDWANATHNGLRFEVVRGRSYQISGWMKGVSAQSGNGSRLRLDFESSPSGARPMRRDKDGMAALLAPWVAWGRAQGVPLYVGEIGLNRACFEGGRGGLRWAEDMIDLLRANDLHFTWHAYHEGAFGLYRNDAGLPDPSQANDGLIALFRRTLP